MDEKDVEALIRKSRGRRKSYQRAAGLLFIVSAAFFWMVRIGVPPEDWSAWVSLGVLTWQVQGIIGLVLLTLGIFS